MTTSQWIVHMIPMVKMTTNQWILIMIITSQRNPMYGNHDGNGHDDKKKFKLYKNTKQVQLLLPTSTALQQQIRAQCDNYRDLYLSGGVTADAGKSCNWKSSTTQSHTKV